jgi:hypothetical protein
MPWRIGVGGLSVTDTQAVAAIEHRIVPPKVNTANKATIPAIASKPTSLRRAFRRGTSEGSPTTNSTVTGRYLVRWRYSLG